MAANKGCPPEMITPEEMAPRMGTSAQQIRWELQKGVFPIGWADNPTGKKWVYHIIRAEFEAMMAGQLSTSQKSIALEVAKNVANILRYDGYAEAR